MTFSSQLPILDQDIPTPSTVYRDEVSDDATCDLCTLGLFGCTIPAARGALRNHPPDVAEPENPQALARHGWGLDPPVILPSCGMDEAIDLKQVPGGVRIDRFIAMGSN